MSASGSGKPAHPIRCRCGAFQAEVRLTAAATRAVCYCRDCRCFAHFLGRPAGMLDALGGTDIVAVRPRDVRFTQGEDQLACMSLSDGGTLRWYTRCCTTPIGNTPRDFTMSHLGLIHTCLAAEGASLDDAFGPVVMRVNPRGAKGTPPANSPARFALAVLRYLVSITWSRVGGGYRVNPFFRTAEGVPRVPPQTLSPAERATLLAAV